MSVKTGIDLRGVVSPVCLLKCKSMLAKINGGDVLEVMLQDPEVVEELVKIVERSKDQVIYQQKEGDCFRINIQKG